MNRERALASLSTITAVWETRNQDYLDNFVPFVATYFATNSIDYVSRDDLEALSQGLYDLFRIKIPILPLKAILKKARKQRLLDSVSGGYRVNRRLAMQSNIMADLQKNERTYAHVVNAFQDFTASHYDLDLPQPTLEDILYSFINSNDLEILTREHAGRNGELNSHLPRKHRPYEYLVNAFYVNMSENDPVVYESISDMAMGSILSATVFLPEIPDRGETVRGVEFVLDTPLLLKLIGADGTAEQTVVKHLLESVRTQGGKLATYSHIHQETLEILSVAKEWVESTRFDVSKANRTTIFFRQEGFKESDVVRLIAKIEDRYAESGITVKDVPDHSQFRRYHIDDERFLEILENVISERDSQFNAEQFKRRTRRDVDSISAVYRSRGNHRPQTLRDSRVVLISENTALVLANRRLVQSVHPELAGFPACVTDQYVGTVLWIDAPESAMAANRSRILASSSAALRPDASLEKAIVDEANRLRRQGEITSDDFLILTSDHLTRDLLAEKTLGDADALDSRKVLELLNEAKAKLVHSANSEIERLNRSLDNELNEKQAISIERDQTTAAVIGYAERSAKRVATISKAGFRGFIWALALAPILPAIFVHPSISAGVPILGVVFNIVGRSGINGDLVYRRTYTRARARRLRAIGLTGHAALPDD